MNIKSVTAMYFSGTNTTKNMVTHIAENIAKELKVPFSVIDFSVPAQREKVTEFEKDEIVVFGTPVYAGRVPNLLLPYLNENIKGNGAVAVPVVMFGNRAFDNALIELRTILDNDGFRCVAAGAFVGEHSFSYVLGKGRPDAEDFSKADELVKTAIERISHIDDEGSVTVPVPVPGDISVGYYKPHDRKNNFIDIRKVKPKTSDACDNCGLCADICPMGAIDHEDVTNVKGICIKCGACIKRCPKGAKYYDDPGFLYHKEELEAMFKDVRAESVIF